MKSKGFTLIEAVIAVAILSGAVIIIYNVFSVISKNAQNASDKLIGFYLAQEGIEIIANMRSNNWINNTDDWKAGLDSGQCENGCSFELDYRTGINDTLLLRPYAGNLLNIDSNGLYSYVDGSPTIFKRKIKITYNQENTNIIGVECEVMWQRNNRDYSVKIDEKLYNWY